MGESYLAIYRTDYLALTLSHAFPYVSEQPLNVENNEFHQNTTQYHNR